MSLRQQGGNVHEPRDIASLPPALSDFNPTLPHDDSPPTLGYSSLISSMSPKTFLLPPLRSLDGLYLQDLEL